MKTYQDFREEVINAAENRPKCFRYGQAVFNYIDETYGVARMVQFVYNIDCFYDDNNVEAFIHESYLQILNIENNKEF